MEDESAKAHLYAHVASIGKCLSSPKRLELIELLAQGEKSVETLATQARIDVKLASAHLRYLREARMVETRRDGKFVYYRLSGPDIAQLWVRLRDVALEHLLEFRMAVQALTSDPGTLSPETRESLLDKAQRGEVTVIDVRPQAEFDAAHLPHARSMPLKELQTRLSELPNGVAVVAYCRGPFCVMSDAAVQLLRDRGFVAHKISDGVSEWQANGLPLEH